MRAAQMILSQRVTGRTCGDCSACCYALGVKALSKEPETRCDYQIRNVDRRLPVLNPKPGKDCGCSIETVKPDGCRIFDCLWLQGAIPDGDPTPEQLGLVFAAAEAQGFKNAHLVCWPGRPGAFEEDGAKRYLADLAKTYVIVINAGGRVGMIGPPQEVRAAVAALQEQTGARVTEVKK